MPRIKWKLSKSEKCEFLALAEELEPLGTYLDLSDLRAHRSASIKLTQEGSFFESYARRCYAGSLYVLRLSIVALAPKVALEGCELESPDFDLNAYLLDDPSESRSTEHSYRLWDRTEFPRKQVLNHRIDHGMTLRRGDRLQGCLLAQAFEPLPDRFQPGESVPLVLSLMDQFANVTTWPLELHVEAPHARGRPQAFQRESVFADPIPATPNVRTGSIHPSRSRVETLEDPGCEAAMLY